MCLFKIWIKSLLVVISIIFAISVALGFRAINPPTACAVLPFLLVTAFSLMIWKAKTTSN